MPLVLYPWGLGLQAQEGIPTPETRPSTLRFMPVDPAASPIPATAYLDETYTLGSGDVIRVDIFNVPEYSADNGTYPVRMDGTIGVPLVGSVDVQGMTVEQAAQVLASRYTPLLTRPPRLTVTLVRTRPVRIALAGEVKRPGTYVIDFAGGATTENFSGTQLPTLTEAIQASGGVTYQANVRDIEVIRPQRSGQDLVLRANLWDLIQRGDLDQDLRLRDGDRVIVPIVTNPPESESIQVARANFSPESMNVQVVGEVAGAGNVEVPPNTSLNQAILAAGGFKDPRAQTSSVDLIRLNPNGTVERRTLQVNLADSPNEETNPILRPDDVVMVARNDLAVTSDFLTLLLSPITSVTTILRILGL
ncbi:MAG: polysaccharide biosynthesis/export family protein [Cyanobacteriota bacterium]|nr:polysaccharide biosynthesis/export family protein [Cyanobacteriota bacterium]